jgi:hypothetical protein
MKKLISVILALTLVMGLAMVASAATPGDNGWWDDDGEFDGWTVNDDGSFTMINGNGSGKSDNRIGHGIEDPENFEITVVVDSETNSRPIIKLFNLIIELNAENGNGNQFFVKNMDANGNWNHFDWLNATDCIVTVKLVRENGGNLQVTVTGKDNATPITMDMAIGDPTATNIELAMYDCGKHPQHGIATYTVTFPAAEPPATEAPEETEPANPKTGDIAGVVFALLAVSAMGIVVASKKH